MSNTLHVYVHLYWKFHESTFRLYLIIIINNYCYHNRNGKKMFRDTEWFIYYLTNELKVLKIID